LSFVICTYIGDVSSEKTVFQWKSANFRCMPSCLLVQHKGRARHRLIVRATTPYQFLYYYIPGPEVSAEAERASFELCRRNRSGVE
jgi:hypothetical protein